MKTKDIVKNGRLKQLAIESDRWKTLNVEIFKIQDYQYRFVQNGKEIDYFPISAKYHVVKENMWGIIPAYRFINLFENPR